MKTVAISVAMLALVLAGCGQAWPSVAMACLAYTLWPERTAVAVDAKDDQ
jgi:hypothetical protein